MNIYQKELQNFRPLDEIQDIKKVKGFDFISTASHGYLVVPRDGSENAVRAFGLCEYGYKGKHAIYLEEDCEAPEFLKSI